MIKAIFIDIDNTLLDFDAYVKNTMQIGFEKFHIGTYKDYMYDIFTKINNALWMKIEKGIINFEELEKIRWNLVFEELGFSFDGPTFEKYFRASLNDSAIPIKGANKVLSYLYEKDYIICAASNGPHDQQEHRLKIGNMDSYFYRIYTSGLFGVSKPSSEFFQKCVDDLNKSLDIKIENKEILMIGDSISSDICGCIPLEIKTCLFNKKGHPIPEDVHIDYIVNELEEIMDIDFE